MTNSQHQRDSQLLEGQGALLAAGNRLFEGSHRAASGGAIAIASAIDVKFLRRAAVGNVDADRLLLFGTKNTSDSDDVEVFLIRSDKKTDKF